ncbi:hypothetical protein Taro_041743, partial [Colocasia esculenta]|nr:hypothetical protein [Colocasia esculenta]
VGPRRPRRRGSPWGRLLPVGVLVGVRQGPNHIWDGAAGIGASLGAQAVVAPRKEKKRWIGHHMGQGGGESRVRTQVGWVFPQGCVSSEIRLSVEEKEKENLLESEEDLLCWAHTNDGSESRIWHIVTEDDLDGLAQRRARVIFWARKIDAEDKFMVVFASITQRCAPP